MEVLFETSCTSEGYFKCFWYSQKYAYSILEHEYFILHWFFQEIINDNLFIQFFNKLLKTHVMRNSS